VQAAASKYSIPQAIGPKVRHPTVAEIRKSFQTR
jgi:hypothetical protein